MDGPESLGLFEALRGWDALRAVAAVCLVLILASRVGLHPLLALLAGAAVFPLTAGMDLPYFVETVAKGFLQGWQEAALAILAAAVAGTWVAAAGPTAWRSAAVSGRLLAVAVVAGLSPSLTAAYALIAPLVSRGGAATAARRPVAAALALMVGHTLLLPAAGPVTAVAILAADIGHVVAFALPVAAVALVAGQWACAWLTRRMAAAPPPLPPPLPPSLPPSLPPIAAGRRRLLLLPVLLAIAVALLPAVANLADLLVGDPFNNRLLRPLGGPAAVLIVAIAASLAVAWRVAGGFDAGAINRLTTQAIVAAAPLLILVGAAAMLARVLQQTGVAEALGEHLLGAPPPPPLALLLPFLIAALFRTIQGSSAIAMIAAAGFVEPELAALALEGDSGRALAVVAIGAGAMVAPHVNSGLFWLVGATAAMPATATARTLSLAALFQGTAALAALLVLAAAFG